MFTEITILFQNMDGNIDDACFGQLSSENQLAALAEEEMVFIVSALFTGLSPSCRYNLDDVSAFAQITSNPRFVRSFLIFKALSK